MIVGFQEVATPVVTFKEAILFLACPPIVAKSPPTIKFPSEIAKERTIPSAVALKLFAIVFKGFNPAK